MGLTEYVFCISKIYAIRSARSLIRSVWVDITQVVICYHSVVAMCGAGHCDLVQGFVCIFNTFQLFLLDINPTLPGLLKTRWTWGGADFAPLLIHLFLIVEA